MTELLLVNLKYPFLYFSSNLVVSFLLFVFFVIFVSLLNEKIFIILFTVLLLYLSISS